LKFHLKILCDENFERLKDIQLRLENDEIVLQDSTGNPHIYQIPSHQNIESHKLQKAIFHNKRTLIESCLFGVDINHNSCEITKLRLWIELLKYSYYIFENGKNTNTLQTLPNIDINIKCGNSLISYFDITQSLSHYPNINTKIKDYKQAVQNYKEGLYQDKQALDSKIKELHEAFKNFCFKDKFKSQIKAFEKECDKYSAQYGNYLAKDDKNLSIYVKAGFFLEFDEAVAQKDFATLQESYNALFNLESNKPFEWRFAFPEVLDNNGDFLGFDLVIGNPPY
ncbi:restriction endonuclease, partial [Helicobacter sp. 10-6591]